MRHYISSILGRRSLVFILALAGLAAAGGPARAETRVGGTLTGTQTWTKAQAPYIVTKDITIPKGSTLVVEPGVTVRFKSDIVDHKGVALFDLELLVEGTLIAKGDAGDTIYFTSDAPGRRWTDWEGIVLRGKDARAELQALTVEFCNNGVSVRDGAHLMARNLTVQYCEQKAVAVIQGTADICWSVFRDVGNLGGTGVGIYVDRGAEVTVRHSFVVGTQNGIEFARQSKGVVDHTVVSLCAARGMIVRNSSPEITRCTITHNPQGLLLSAGAAPKVYRNNIFDNESTNLVLSEYPADHKIVVSNNWWGNADLGMSEEGVLDALDDDTRGAFAVLEPVLSEALTFDAGAEATCGP